MHALLALLFAIQDPTPEEVFTKLEARTSAIGQLAADVTMDGSDFDDVNLRIACRLEYVRGGHLRRTFHLWAGSEGMLMSDDFFSPKIYATRAVFAANREGAFFATSKTDPAKPAPLSRGVIDAILTMFGLEFNLVDVALYPRMIQAFGTDVQAALRKDKITLSVTRSVSNFGMSEEKARFVWVFDAATYRIEKLEIDTGRVVSIDVTAYEKVNGVELPSRVKRPGTGFRGGDSELIVSGFRSVKTSPPAWVSDPAIPFATNESADDLRAKLAKDPKDPAAALAYVQSVWAGIIKERSGGAEFVPALEAAAERGADSSLFQTALYCAYLLKKNDDGCAAVAKRIAEKKWLCPEVAVLRATQLLTEGKHEDLLEILDALGTETIFADLGVVLGLAARAALATDGGEFAKTIQSACEGLEISRRIELFFAVESAPSKRGRGAWGVLAGKPAEFLQKLVESGHPESLLLAARANARNGKAKEAAELYAKLTDRKEWLPAIQPELQAFCVVAKAEAAPILEKIYDQLTDVELLLLVAEMHLDRKDDAKAEQAIRRALEMFPKRQRTYRDSEVVVPVLKKLLDQGKKDLAKELLLAAADRMNASNYLYGEDNIVDRVLGDDHEKKYDFLRAAGVSSYSLERVRLTPAQTFEIAKKRMDSDARVEEDATVLCAFVVDGSLRQEAKSEDLVAALEKAVKYWPDRMDLRERLGDLHLLDSRWAQAISHYREALRLEKENKPKVGSADYEDVVVRPPRRIEPDDGGGKQDFDPWRPLLVKLTHALMKSDDRPGAIQTVEDYLKDFPDRLEVAAEAFEALELAEPLLALKKKILLRRAKSVTPKEPWNAESVAMVAIEFARLSLQHKHLEDAYVASEMAVEYAKMSPDGDSVKNAESLRAEVLKAYSDEDVIRAFASGPFDPIPDETKKEVEGLLAQLEAEEPFERQEAEEKLRGMGAKIAPLLIAAMKDQTGETLTRLQTMVLGHARKALREKFMK